MIRLLLPCAAVAILMARNRVADASEPVVGDEAAAAHGEERFDPDDGGRRDVVTGSASF